MSDADLRRYYDESYPPSLWEGGGTQPPEFNVNGLTPTDGSVGIEVALSIRGVGFVEGCEAFIRYDIPVANTETPLPTTYIDEGNLVATFTPWQPGAPCVSVKNPDGAVGDCWLFWVYG